MNSKTKYQIGKTYARNEAIEYQCFFDCFCYTHAELASFCDYFTKLGKRYGLLKEFKENGII